VAIPGQKPLNLQTPNQTAPICTIDADVSTMLLDSTGKPVTGRLTANGLVTAAWRYLFNVSAAAAAGRPQRSIRLSADLPIKATDSILNVNATADLGPLLPSAAARNGAPLTFKNLPGSATQTLKRTLPDQIDGVNTYTLNAGSGVTLVPYNDGVNNGWAIE